jgi:hypothetical protein
LDIYNSGGDSSQIIASASGGLTFNLASLPTLFSYTGYFPNGKYFGKLTYKNYDPTLPDGQPNPELLTQVKWEKEIFTGYENQGFLTARIVRSGFNETPFGIQVSGSLITDQGLPYIGLDLTGFKSGFYTWSGEIKDSLDIRLPLFNNNKWENDYFGKLSFNLDLRGFPSQSVSIPSNEAEFIIIDDDIPQCVKECYSTSSPSSIQGIGIDSFLNL